MTESGYAQFDTRLGTCGVTWGPAGISGVRLPPATGTAAGTPPPPVAAAITRMTALLNGEADDLTDIELDLSGLPEFNLKVYEVARAIPPGQTMTYGEVARAIGLPGSAQAVGQALGRNPCPIIVPCHRVLGADGKMGGFSAPGGTVTKLKLLAIEDAAPNGQPSLF
ncbi:methylated-DNA--[protein]-cysteine S-methyltransferase [Actinokineospora sp. HUAS TT18]|uniref:methylated-DNA--[protein]-cysteine S-methyltransferase n=1 Tax=Actinokineospora sp. HUAS TT18 TaxID=3447451 RepID=UPI003F5275A0